MSLRLVLFLAALYLPSQFVWGQVTDEDAEIKTNASAADDSQAEPDKEDYYELLMVFADTIDQVERNYVEEIDRRELLEAAIEGVLRRLDPYSNYIAPDEIDSFKVEVENEFGGIGIQIASDRGQLKVISPLVGTPAYRAGIQAGDIILAINGKRTQGMSLNDAVQLMKGRAETSLALKILHPFNGEREDIVLQREVVKVQTVLGDRRKSDDSWNYIYDESQKIGYVRLTAFSRDTGSDLREAMKTLTDAGAKSLVLDLRFNPGGLLRAAIEVSDTFLKQGTIVSTEGRNILSQTWEARSEETYDAIPLAVLVNQYSASASEIVAAALQDHDRAVVIGHQTYGKASVQNYVELEEGRSAIKLTTGSYRRPSGKPIHRFPDSQEWGVRPNPGFEVLLTEEQIYRLMTQRRQRDIIPSKDAAAEQGSVIPDPQLERAIEHLVSVMKAGD
jgi:carboxyl-terminal processing protease